MYNNPYEPCNYNNFPPNYLLSSYLKMIGEPAMLIWVFILSMFFAIPALVVGVVVASGLGIGLSVLRLAGVGITLAVIIVVITSLKFVLRIFAVKGSNGARIPLLLFLWLTLIPESLSLVLTISVIFEPIERILLASGNISEYCKYREFLAHQRQNQRGQSYHNNVQSTQGRYPVINMNLFQRRDPEASYNRLIIKYNSWQTPVLRRGSHRLSYNRHTAVLTAEHGPLAGQRFLLDPLNYYVIVREGDIRISLFNRKTSRRHVRIDSENRRYVITYLNSTNHTYINGKMITHAVLNNDGMIKIGDSYLDLRG